MVKEKRWKDAKEFYTQGLGALSQKLNATKQSAVDGEKLDLKPISEEEKDADRQTENTIEEALYINRALCNLELSASPVYMPMFKI